MSNILVAQMKQYIKQTHTPMRNRTSWQSRTRGRVFEDKQNVQQGSEQPQGAFSQSEKPLVEQVKYYKEYTSLLKEGRDVFPSSVEYQNWKEQLDDSYKNNLPLDTFSYTLDMFTALQKAETSAIYQQEVDDLAKDKDNFGEFTEIAQKTGEEYVDASFTSTSGFNKALDSTATNGSDLTIIETSSGNDVVDHNVEMPKTNMVVVEFESGMIANPEVLIDDDGKVDKAQVTTARAQNHKERVFNGLVANSSTQEEVDALVEAFTPDVLANSDPEADLSGAADGSSSALVKPDDVLTLDKVSDEIEDDSLVETPQDVGEEPVQDLLSFRAIIQEQGQ